MDEFDTIATAIFEILYDSGYNCFIVNNNKLLHDLISYHETVGVTGGTQAIVTCKVTLCLLLKNKSQRLMIQFKNFPCIESSPPNGFPIIPFRGYGFQKAIHSARHKVTHKYDLPVTN